MVNGSVTMCFCLVDAAAATAAKLKTLLETLRAPTSERARVNGDSNVLACYDLRKGCSLPARGPDFCCFEASPEQACNIACSWVFPR